MVTIRLRRAGTTKKAFFHIVATDSRYARDGRFLEKIGHYDPRKKPAVVVIDQARLEHWRKAGALTSETVSQLLKRNPPQAAKAAEEPKAKAKKA
jgi:small subunit ribosomal protein S16